MKLTHPAYLFTFGILFVSQVAAQDTRPVSWTKLVPNILRDQEAEFLRFPKEVAHGRHWVPMASILAVTGALIATDQYTAPRFRRTHSFEDYNAAFSSNRTSLGIFIAPVALYGAGLLARDPYSRNTALLAGEALADAEIVATLLKVSTHRLRPSGIAKNGNFADSWLDSKTTFGGAFPSGHTIAAFSVATVIERRYGKQHRWVPLVAYGLASAVGFSRMSLSAHFPSDVFLGAALGYSISRFTVLRQ